MSERTALEIADKLDELSSIMRIHNVPTLPKLHDYGKKATDMLRQQHAEIERLTALNSALTAKSNAFVIENARQAEEIERLTAERDAAIASAVAAEREVIDMTSKIYEALNHVRLFYPEITHVFYNDEGEWYYCDKEFEGPLIFSRSIDIGLLEDAARSIDILPAAFSIHEETE